MSCSRVITTRSWPTARRIGRNEAEDAAAEVFAIASRRAKEIDLATARPCLYGIARGVLANNWRSFYRRQRIFGLIAGMAPTSEDRPDEVVVRRAEDREAIAALQQLRPIDREVLMLSAWEELTGPQIASALGISVAAAEQRLHRAKERYAHKLWPLSVAGSRDLTFENEGGN
ncbi:MAG TPA: sigma-70 family RNA polymerase sigma factor [Acidimicrobiia bacterium]|nr:sigma-70 family RNA polymerase sigma factor [Acidimicrobiia bacterium]